MMFKVSGLFIILVGLMLNSQGYSSYVASGVTKYKNLNLIKGVTFRLANLDNTNNRKEFVLLLEGGKVYEDGKVLTKDDKLVEDVIVLEYGKSISTHRLLKLKRTKDSPKYEKFHGRLAVIASSGSENFYHWIFQILPRIKILKESKVKWDKLYFYEIDKPYQWETLEQLGIEKEDILIGKPDHIYEADVLIVPDIPVWPAKGLGFSTWVIQFLRSSFLPTTLVSKKFPSKIFILRKKAASRQCVNRQEVVETLRSAGYQGVSLEDYSIMEQASMFRQAKEIIGVHGSGLTNLIYCEPGTKVIEITPYDGHRGPFSRLAKTLSLNYEKLLTNGKRLSLEQKEKDAVYVDIHKLQALLRTPSSMAASS